MIVKVTSRTTGEQKNVGLLDAMIIFGIGAVDALRLDNGFILTDNNYTYEAITHLDN